MAVMSAAERLIVRNHLMRVIPFPGALKLDVGSAVDTIDSGLNAATAAVVAGIPASINNLGAATKDKIIAYVAMRRAGLLTTQEG